MSALGTPGPQDALVEVELIAARGPDSALEYQQRPARRALAAFRYRDFRLYWTGQLVSLVGTWMQVVAQSWLVLELSDSALALGLLTALQFLPILSLSVLGGVLADRLPRRALLLATQPAAMVLAVTLGILTQTGAVRIEHVMALAVLLGVVNAVDMPTRQAFIVDLVRPDDLSNAIALNSAAFNSARLVGPAIGGLAIGVIGLAGTFFLNGVSFLPAIATLLALQAGRAPAACPAERIPVLEDLREGFRYIVRTPLVRLVIAMVALVGTFGLNLAVLVPVLARSTLRVGASGYGYLAAAAGAGSLSAAALLASLARTPSPSVLLVAAAALGILEVVAIAVTQLLPAVLLLFAIGFAMVFFVTLANTLVQSVAPPALRGRVMSVYTTVFAGTTPLSSLLAGTLAQAFSAGTASPTATPTRASASMDRSF
ncbi:MAG: MFS transporter, partial [Anaerolineae bacterium]|nr:MFS transporter [Anaerolineae bacterium]